MMLGGKVHGNAEKLMKGFTDSKGKSLPKAKNMLFVSTTEASERATKAKVQGMEMPKSNGKSKSTTSKGANGGNGKSHKYFSKDCLHVSGQLLLLSPW